jgi:uncharacterized protein YpmS
MNNIAFPINDILQSVNDIYTLPTMVQIQVEFKYACLEFSNDEITVFAMLNFVCKVFITEGV